MPLVSKCNITVSDGICFGALSACCGARTCTPLPILAEGCKSVPKSSALLPWSQSAACKAINIGRNDNW